MAGWLRSLCRYRLRSGPDTADRNAERDVTPKPPLAANKPSRHDDGTDVLPTGTDLATALPT
jgi:hypothetical protein